MRKNIFDDYEQMSSGIIETNNRYNKRNKFCTKRKLFIFILLLSIIIFIIYLKFKSKKNKSKTEEESEEKPKTDLENELDILTKKEEELKNENNKLLSQKESLKKENEKISEEIKELKEKENNDENILKEISEKEEKIKEYESKIKESKDNLDELTKKQKDLNDKLNENNSEIKNLEQKIEELEKELKNNEKEEKKEKVEEEEKEEEKKGDENKKDNDDKNEDKDKKEENKDNEQDERVQKLKSRIDSKIIIDPKHLELLDKWFNKELNYKLLYRASEEQYLAKNFHSKVDEFKNTIIFIKDVNNFIFGGFTRKTWDGTRIFKSDQNAIVFNLDKGEYYKINDANHAIFCDPDYLAIFGEGDIYLGPKSIETSFPKTYGNLSENKKFELTMGYNKLSPVEMEVFQLS